MAQYDDSGWIVWAKTLLKNEGLSQFVSVSVSRKDEAYAAGIFEGDQSLLFDAGISLSSDYERSNLMLARN